MAAIPPSFTRFLIPRRKENVVICILLFFLCSSLIYVTTPFARQYNDPEMDMFIPRKQDIEHNLGYLHVIPDYSKARSGPGEDGKPVVMQTAEEQRLANESMKKWFMNLVASDRISYDRSIPDNRMLECKNIQYEVSTLPNVSVVIIFNNEAWSVLIRTVHSVYNRSPPKLLHEIVLLDDASDREELGLKLDNYVKRFNGKVKVVRRKTRQGLIRARLEGAKAATGQVLFFLDSHCEANTGWLEPIVARIKEKRTAVLCPLIEAINDHTLAYRRDSGQLQVGGFTWSLFFTWMPIQQSQKHKLAHEPINSPTMAGGLFAVDRNYFFEIGGYDPGMDIWGGENLEISFRTWMCGGSLEYIPCSHVGHIFRSGHPYNMTTKDVHGYNSARLAEVWLDDYKRLYYMHRPDLENAIIGDISDRVALRKRLNCKSFKWYLDEVFPEKYVPDENVIEFGTVKNLHTGLCLDTLQRDEKHTIGLAVFSCQGGKSSAQLFSLSKKNELRREDLCADSTGSEGEAVKLIPCHGLGQNQRWLYSNKVGQIVHYPSSLCLDVKGISGGADILIQQCDNSSPTQKWIFSRY